VSRVTFPVDGSRTNALAPITGTAKDEAGGSGIPGKANIAVSICETSPGTACWTGVVPGTFTAITPETFYPLSGASLGGTYDGSSNWSVSTPTFRDGYTYRVRVRATDDSRPGGNVETAISSITFTYDITPPTVGISKPVNSQYYGDNASQPNYYLDQITGTAADAFGIARTEMRLYNVGANSYWTSGVWVVGVSSWLAAGKDTWQYTPPALSDGFRYRLEARAYELDSAVVGTILAQRWQPSSDTIFFSRGRYFMVIKWQSADRKALQEFVRDLQKRLPS